MANNSVVMRNIREHGPLAAFGFFTLTGCAFICLSKYLAWPPYVVTGLPVLLMLGYGASNIWAKGLRLHDEQAGDNLYYMGFLFTLTSLGASLYQFTSTSSIDDIVRNFGVAVASTIVGIALRILYNQMRRDPLDIERATRHEIADMSRRIRSELDGAALEFATYRRTSNQMLQEGFDEIARQAEITGQQVLKTMENLSLAALAPIQRASQDLHAITEKQSKILDQQMEGNSVRVGAAGESINRANIQLTESIAKFALAVEATGKKLESIRTPEEVLKIELGSIMSTMAKITAEHTKRMDVVTQEQTAQFQQVRETFGPVDKIINGLERSIASSDELMALLREQNGHVLQSIKPAIANRLDVGRSNAMTDRAESPNAAKQAAPPDSQVDFGSLTEDIENLATPAEPKKSWWS